MNNIKFLSLIVTLIGLLGCSKDEIEKIYPTLDNHRLTKILNYSSSTDKEPNTFVDLEYNEYGNLHKESLYDYPNTLFTFREYFYENNLLKEKRIYDGQVGNLQLGTYSKYEYENNKLIAVELFLSDGTLKYTEHYEYNGNNLVNTYKFNDELGIHHQFKYTYNDFDSVILEENYMYDQKLEGFTKYYYDDNLRLIKTEIFNFDETIIQTEEQKYVGASTTPIEELYYDSEGKLSQQRQLLYDNLGNLIETKIIDSQGTHTLFKKKYNGNLLIEHVQYIPSFGYSEWYVTRYEYSKIK
jgi:hypothetical protein